MKVIAERDRKRRLDRRKDESYRRDRQKKDEWIGVKISRKDESRRRDRLKKNEWI